MNDHRKGGELREEKMSLNKCSCWLRKHGVPAEWVKDAADWVNDAAEWVNDAAEWVKDATLYSFLLNQKVEFPPP